MEDTPASLIANFLNTYSVSQSELCRLSGVSRKSIYKYLHGLPIHRLKARQMSEAMWTHYKHYIPIEKLMLKK